MVNLLLLLVFVGSLAFAEELKSVQFQSSSVSKLTEKSTKATNGEKPVIVINEVYIRDFELDEADMKKDSGVAGKGMRNRLPILSRKNDLEEKTRKLVETMSDSLVKEFSDQGILAHRVSRSTPLPNSGILVSGGFTQVDEGSRIKRTVIGFGKGEVKTEVYVNVFDLSVGRDSPVIAFGSDKNSRKMPGAIVTMNPFVAATKFYLEKNATEKVVKRLAGSLVEEILKFRAPPANPATK